MPRHPPCALNNLPTTNHQHTQTQQASRAPVASQWDKPVRKHTRTIIYYETTQTPATYVRVDARVHYQGIKEPEPYQRPHEHTVHERV